MQDEVIAAAEAALRAAMLAGDVAALDALVEDHLSFTDQAGNRLSKADDLAAYRSGRLKLETIDLVDPPDIRRWGDCATVCVTVDLAGFFRRRKLLRPLCLFAGVARERWPLARRSRALLRASGNGLTRPQPRVPRGRLSAKE